MIQEERERRAALQAEEGRRLEEDAILNRVKAEQFIKEAIVVAEENRSFISKSRVPEYLQAIVEEEQHKETYVLWWLKHPDGVPGVACFNEVTNDGNPDMSKRRLVRKGPPFTRISLVWGIGFLTKRVFVEGSGYVSGGIMDGQYKGVGYGGYYSKVQDGYSFRSIDVDGSSKEELLIVRGIQIYRRANTPYEEGGRTYRPVIDLIRPTETILHGGQLDQPEILRQVLASTYLDTLESKFSYKVNSWPFDKQVPKQEKETRLDRNDNFLTLGYIS